MTAGSIFRVEVNCEDVSRRPSGRGKGNRRRSVKLAIGRDTQMKLANTTTTTTSSAKVIMAWKFRILESSRISSFLEHRRLGRLRTGTFGRHLPKSRAIA